jgi:SAM-dependent methyltransferase
VVLPGVLRLLNLTAESSLIDLGCGQGILSHVIPPIKEYFGLDKAAALIDVAKRAQQKLNYAFRVNDVSRPIPAIQPSFTHAAIILALQNMEYPQGAIQNAGRYLVPGGKLVIVLNHPSFRIPRQSGWDVDAKTKQQYRWENRYLSPLKIPITMNPGQSVQQQGAQKVTWSFHRPLQDYVAMLREAGFVITGLEEWVSDKQSAGKAASMENRSRGEFPLFMAVVAEKK